jgi:hypothetical protein
LLAGLLLSGAVSTAHARDRAPAFQGSLQIGFGKPGSDDGDNFDFGPNFGLQLGARVAAPLSLSARGAFAVLQPEADDLSGRQFQVGFVPLLHLLSLTSRPTNADLFVGPSIGYYRRWGEWQLGGNRVVDAHEDNLYAGFMMGVSFPVGRAVSLGFLFSYDLMFADEVCGEAFGVNGCLDDDRDRSFANIAAFVGF